MCMRWREHRELKRTSMAHSRNLCIVLCSTSAAERLRLASSSLGQNSSLQAQQLLFTERGAAHTAQQTLQTLQPLVHLHCDASFFLRIRCTFTEDQVHLPWQVWRSLLGPPPKCAVRRQMLFRGVCHFLGGLLRQPNVASSALQWSVQV